MKIPATVITGFLGAGKTTLIRHIMANNAGKRIALVINEFGDLGIDRELVTGCGIEGCEDENVVELANGCICCTVADDFLPTIEALLDRPEPPDHIVIETSGLALPKPLVKAFNWPEVRSRVTVDGVVTVVDAPAVAAGQFADDPIAVQAQREADEMLDHDNPLEEVFEDQLLCADMVLLNKTDLLDAAALDAVRAEVKGGVDAQVKLVDTVQGVIDTRVLLGIGAGVEDVIEGRWSHHDAEDDHDHDDFESFTVSLGDIDDPAELEARIQTAAVDHDILRVKGFIHVPGKDMRHVVQAVGARVQRYYDRPWADGEARTTELVVIGQTGLDHAAITSALGAEG
ncbi:MAG: cobalamin biosynthesis protein CobW [Rhodospirillaceae bacterium]|nr:cobalamin biosynthesis protein CobW [Rhodospirillaceae bacterium]MBT5297979.1 cobalamin biosynthesis protein CobW [Rhodospirillaceae bacterium]MBT6883085.1 cobalamin biosynthesis protein CobW [Rhodospirillaceae bacterium]MBT7249001.1 cobalamin biosynthesis protein CobW [Rhodospirillaceae bacterium]